MRSISSVGSMNLSTGSYRPPAAMVPFVRNVVRRLKVEIVGINQKILKFKASYLKCPSVAILA